MIERTAVVGAGAVGASIASMIVEAGAPVALVAEGERARRLERGVSVNGVELRIDVDPEIKEPYDLVILATKATQLAEALPLVRRAAGPDGLVVSLLNGISSESAIRAAIGGAEERVVDAMILGIDAVRDAAGVTYRNRGTIHYGLEARLAGRGAGRLARLQEYFPRVRVPARLREDIVHALWWKFMINVGINQASAVLRAPYGLFQISPDARDLMVSAMQEVVTLSGYEGVALGQADIDAWLETLATLDPGGKTSMVQDVEAGRPTEVDLFAGTVLELSQRHGLDVPVNRTLARLIRALEVEARF